MSKTCLSPNQINLLGVLRAETIAIEARNEAEKAAREAYLIEMAEARIEAVKIDRAVAARRKTRTCLCCGGEFLSEHSGHRRCGTCDQIVSLGSLPEFTVHAAF
jgi:ribosomal protein S27AE